MGIKVKSGAVETPKNVYEDHLSDSKMGIGHTNIVKTTVAKGGEKDEKLLGQSNEIVHKGVETKDKCVVRVSGGQTISTAPFESVRLDVSLSMPCEKEDIEATYEFVTEWVSQKLIDAAKEAKA